MAKFIFVTGGVVSGLGKGICAASLGRLLKQCGLRVRNQKFDPYLNVDPGTMSPYQHGEVFVTDDGAETDLDLGHYERFVDEALTGDSSVSSGKIFWSVLNRERQGGYLGGTVQIIPHITDEIKSRIYQMDDGKTDVLLTEIGGTVGDIESQPYLEAIRQVAAEQGRENVLYIHVPLVVSIPGNGELKSKPTQHSVKELLSVGIQPDILVCRTDSPLPEDMRKKIALFCNVSGDCVIPNLTASTLYEVPLLLEREGLCRVVCRKLGLGVGEPDFKTPWSVRDAGIRSLELGRTKYTANAGLKDLRKEICTYLQRRFELHYQEENVLVTVGGSEAIDLTKTEWDLMLLFVRNRGAALYRDVMYERVWGGIPDTESLRTVDTHIARLRKKLGWMDKIETVYKIGYRLKKED